VAFVKAHGALYNRAAQDPDVARALIDGAGQRPLLVLAYSPLADLALSSGRAVYREAFADRRYQDDGTLTPRAQAGALLDDPEEIAAQAVAIATGVPVDTAEGGRLTVRCDSICVHGDSPGAVQAARSVRAALDREGVTLAAFV
jgi:5-oxoprolinase (ATP-hydrolysing) subunit A